MVDVTSSAQLSLAVRTKTALVVQHLFYLGACVDTARRALLRPAVTSVRQEPGIVLFVVLLVREALDLCVPFGVPQLPCAGPIRELDSSDLMHPDTVCQDVHFLLGTLQVLSKSSPDVRISGQPVQFARRFLTARVLPCRSSCHPCLSVHIGRGFRSGGYYIDMPCWRVLRHGGCSAWWFWGRSARGTAG